LYVCVRGNWYFPFLRFSYSILELFRQYGILRISIYSNMNYIFLHTHILLEISHLIGLISIRETAIILTSRSKYGT
jgi:hypothetical protein